MTAECRHHCLVPLENGDGVVIDNQLAALLSDFTLETAVSGVIFKHVGLKEREESDRFWVSLYCWYRNNNVACANIMFRTNSLITCIAPTTVILLTM